MGLGVIAGDAGHLPGATAIGDRQGLAGQRQHIGIGVMSRHRYVELVLHTRSHTFEDLRWQDLVVGDHGADPHHIGLRTGGRVRVVLQERVQVVVATDVGRKAGVHQVDRCQGRCEIHVRLGKQLQVRTDGVVHRLDNRLPTKTEEREERDIAGEYQLRTGQQTGVIDIQ